MSRDRATRIATLNELGPWFAQQKAEEAGEEYDDEEAKARKKEEGRYAYVDEGLDFLLEQDARRMPVGEFDRYITVRDSWVFIRGWMGCDTKDQKIVRRFNKRMRGDDVELRFLINSLAFRSKVLLLDAMTNQVFEYFRSYSYNKGRIAHYLSTADAFRMTLNIVWLVKRGYVKPQDAVHRHFLEDAYRNITDPKNHGSSDIATLRAKSVLTLNSLKSKIHDPSRVLTLLVKDRWQILAEPNYEDDGWQHYLTLPSWMVGMEFNEEWYEEERVKWTDLAGHRIDTWNYYNETYQGA